jgi:hypothetical protein
MKKSLKTKILARVAFVSFIAGSLGATVIAQAQNYGYGGGGGVGGYGTGAPVQNSEVDGYSVWCDQVTQKLMIAQSLGWNLYHRQLYAQARAQILIALQEALGSMNIPGSAFRPATYREIMRTIELIQALDAMRSSFPGGESPQLKAKMIAYVALQRISFISYVKDAVDVTYNIPCRKGCNYEGYDRGAHEGALAALAAEQVSRAQGYASEVGGDGMVYPINDTPYYFVIVASAARWAAEDLSMELFSKRFSCAIINLRTLGSRAASYQSMLGDVTAVQEIHAVANDLIAEMSYSPYGCGYHW